MKLSKKLRVELLNIASQINRTGSIQELKDNYEELVDLITKPNGNF